jgi:hypothetical protein
MSSLPPQFHELASEEDDARWAAYQALMARTAPPAPEESAFEDDPIASADGDDDEEPLTLDREGRSDIGPATRAAAPSKTRPRPRRRALRLVSAVASVTAGLVLATFLVPHSPRERTVVLPRPAAIPAQRAAVSTGPATPTAPSAPIMAEAAPASAAPSPAPTLALRAEEALTTAAAPAARPAPSHRRPAAAQSTRTDAKPATNRYGALSCWLTVMNNSEANGYSDAGVSVCQKNAQPDSPPAPPPPRDEN